MAMKRITWVAAGGALVLLAGAVGAAGASGAAGGSGGAVPDRGSNSRTGELMATALGEAMASAQNSFTVPAAASLGRSAKAGRLAATPSAIKSLPARAELEKQRAAGNADLSRTMTGTALAKNVGTMNTWIDAQENGSDDPNFRPMGGGVSAVRLTSMTVS